MLMTVLRSANLDVRLNSKGELMVKGLKAHPDLEAEQLRSFIRRHKSFIARELQKTESGNIGQDLAKQQDSKKLNNEAETFLSWVQNGHVHLYTDNQGGLYPAKTAQGDWAEKNWSYVQKTWMRCFSDIFKAFENGKLDRYVRSYCAFGNKTASNQQSKEAQSA